MKYDDIDGYYDKEGHLIHREDDGEILHFKEGWICEKCDLSGDW